MSKVTLSIRVNEATKQQIEQISATQNIKKSDLIAQAIKTWLDKQSDTQADIADIKLKLAILEDRLNRLSAPSPTSEPDPEPEPEISEDDCTWLWTDGLQLSQPQRMNVLLALNDVDNPREILPPDQQARFDPHARSYLTYNGHKLAEEALGIFFDGETIKRSQIAKYYKD